MRIHGIMQHDNRDCGVACLTTILESYGVKIPMSNLREQMKVDKNGTSLYCISQTAKTYGLNSSVLQGTYNELNSDIERNKIKLPLIAHVVINEYEGHYVIITKVCSKTIYFFDPACGNRRMNKLEFEDKWTGYIIAFEKTNDFKKINYSKSQYKKFWRIFVQQKNIMVLILFFSLLLSIIMLISAYSYQAIIDNYILEKNNSVLDNLFSNANAFFCMLIIIYVVQMIINIIKSFLVAKASYKVNKNLIYKYVHEILHLPMSFFCDRETGEVISRLTDINDVEALITEMPITIIINFFMVLISGTGLFFINKIMFSFVVCIVIIYGIIVAVYKKPIQNIKICTLENNSRMISRLKEAVDNIIAVKCNCIEKEKEQELENIGDKMLRSVLKGNILSKVEGAILGSVENIGVIFTLWIGSYMALSGSITVGSLVAFESLISFFLSPFQQLIEMQLQLQGAWIAMGRLNDIFDVKKEEDLNYTARIEEYKSDVTYSDVTFSYGDGVTLENVSVVFEYGKKYAIVGKSGCGKSTLMKLLVRYYTGELGRILIGEHSINDLNISELRKQVKYVSSETKLFAGSILYNLLLGNKEINTPKFNEIVEGCNLLDVIEKMPNKFETQISEGGIELSSGQRQRIIIAQALLADPQILIFDEATSHIDEGNEYKIINFILEYCKEKLCIFILHNESVVKLFDKVYKLENGSIVEY